MKCKLQCYIAHRVGLEKEHQAAAVELALGTCKRTVSILANTNIT